MQALGLFIEALQRTPLDAEQERLLSYLGQSQRSQARILNTLLDLSRLDTGAVTVTHREESVASFLGSLVEEFSPVAQAKGLRLLLYLPRRELMMRTDPGLLHSLMRNLVDNAIKFTHHGGVLVAARMQGEKILLQIWDTGRGIPENLRDSIFEEYVQLDNAHRDQANGLGLGLAIVRRLSRLLNLTIRVDSRVGHGSVFSLSIPPALSAAPAQDDYWAPSPGEAEMHRKRVPVVVVDDNQFALEAFASALRSHGFAVDAFADAEAVLERKTFADQTIFVVDYRLPGMSGKELLEHLGTRLGHAVRGIIVSGDIGNPDLADAGQVWPVLFKPVAPHRLIAALDGLSGPSSP
jgi:CheY-like chemotaxis protein